MTTAIINQPEIDKEEIFARIRAAISAGMSQWVEAGKDINKLVDSGVQTQEIAERLKVPDVVVSKLSKLGHGTLMPQLLFSSYPAVAPIGRLPSSTQKDVLEKGVEVLTDDGQVLIVSAENLTTQQCRQVFSLGTVRTLAAQRAWMESERTRLALSSIPEVHANYRVKGGKIIINAPCQLTQKDLARMMAEIAD